MTDYEMGRDAFHRHQRCALFRAMVDPTTCPPELAQRLFLPPVAHDDIDRNLRRPLPRAYADWRRGYADAQAS